MGSGNAVLEIKVFTEALNANAGNVGATCQALGITRRAYEKRYAKDRDFRDACDEVFLAKRDNALTSLYREGIEGDVNAAKYYNEAMERKLSMSESEAVGGGRRRSLATMSVDELDDQIHQLKAERNLQMKKGVVMEDEFIDEPEDEFEDGEALAGDTLTDNKEE